MIIGDFDLNKHVLIVAEIGNNHEGSCGRAAQMIELAAEAGAGAVKFQTFKTERFVRPSDHARFTRLKSFELSYSDFEKLAETAARSGVLFLSTPLDIESARFLDGLVPAFKIASGDNNFYPLIEAVADTAKPIVLSSGLADVAQLLLSKDLIERSWRRKGIDPEIAVLHCVTSYPVPDGEANLGAIRELRESLGCTVGYSDHTTGIEAATLSVALGARIIEKHFTLDKNFSDFRDHQLSADPAEMAQLVERVKRVQTLLGTGRKELQDCERNFSLVARRSIVARRDLSGGTLLSWDDIAWMRPADGLAPGDESLIIGKRLGYAVREGDPITLEHLAPERETRDEQTTVRTI
ncbi:MAG TPA: N-acetylneuraminate synthase family protein [Blastocatellia bacterium]|nr:N-acetylneuraminate synthase family protein [Blastocatellia bacterium]